MDNQRLFLIIALGLVLFLIWQAWTQEHLAQQPKTPSAPSAQKQTPASSSANRQGVPNPSDVPGAGAKTAATPKPAKPTTPSAPPGQRVKVITDQYIAEISTRGGTLVGLKLRNYYQSQQDKQPVDLLAEDNAKFYIVQSGLIATKGAAPNHHQIYHAARDEYRMKPGENKLVVPLTWTNRAGVKVIKTFTFERNHDVIQIGHRVENGGHSVWRGSQYRQLVRTEPAEGHGFASRFYAGGVYSTPSKHYEKVSFGDMAKQNLNIQVQGGWVAMSQHYFLGALIPGHDQTNTFYTKKLSDGRYVLGMVGEPKTVAPGSAATFSTKLYAGPKDQDRLEAAAPYLSRTVDYGWLWFLSQPLFYLLNWIHQFIGNWGWSIIILTIFIKLVFFKLSETSYRSMANMKKMGPRMQRLKELYGDDRQKLNQAMMELYKKEKINPLGGCLPMVVQIPVFIALYWMLLESVELRQAPWILWIHDLSTKDPYYILPILMGITMFAQQRLNPTPPDPMQAKLMMALPLVFTVFFLWFPSGLVLYYLVNNLLSIAQQWLIMRRMDTAQAKA